MDGGCTPPASHPGSAPPPACGRAGEGQPARIAQTAIDDYAGRRAAQIEWWTSQNGRQSGDPAKLAQALVTIAGEQPPRRRFIAGAHSIASTEQKVADLQADIDLNRERFVSLDVMEA